MRDVERDNRIVAMRARGRSLRSIADVEGLSKTRTIAILRRHMHCITDRSVPNGMSVRTACYIEQATGLWPTDENAAEISLGRLDRMGMPGARRSDWLDLDNWLRVWTPFKSPTQASCDHCVGPRADR
jgi:hypothetical protein